MTYQPPQTPYYPPPATPAAPVPPVPAEPAPRRRTGAIVGALVAGIALGVGGTVGVQAALGDDDQAAASSATPSASIGPNFKRVLDACGAGDGIYPGREVTDNGKTLIMQTGATGISIDGLGCVLEKLGASDAIVEHIDTTRALDGQQTDSWAGLSARWTYHPDNGLQITITKS